VVRVSDGWWRKPKKEITEKTNLIDEIRRVILMKNTIRKICAAFLAASIASVGVACSSQTAAPAAAAPASQQAASGAQGKSVRIGVIQYAVNASLDNCYTGFKKGIEESGYKIGGNLTVDFQNAQADPSNAGTIAKSMVAKKYDMIMAIATPAAMAAYGAAKTTNTPVVFTSVVDPLASGLVQSLQKPGGNCTGSSDVLPLEDQMKMIREFLPKAKRIGVLHTTSETNSTACLKQFRSLAPKYGFEIVDIDVTGSSDVEPAVKSLIAKGVDCINNFTDNNVVNHLPALLQAANQAKIPIFGSEVEQVKDGCLASVSIDFVALGEETGKMAAQILDGKVQPATTPVYVVNFGKPVYNKAVLDKLGMKLPTDFASAEAVSK
jgi:putative tryptophan/tyrosine transport system substrate-binding protein